MVNGPSYALLTLRDWPSIEQPRLKPWYLFIADACHSEIDSPCTIEPIDIFEARHASWNFTSMLEISSNIWYLTYYVTPMHEYSNSMLFSDPHSNINCVRLSLACFWQSVTYIWMMMLTFLLFWYLCVQWLFLSPLKRETISWSGLTYVQWFIEPNVSNLYVSCMFSTPEGSSYKSFFPSLRILTWMDVWGRTHVLRAPHYVSCDTAKLSD